jgi:hypothetical protein
MEDAEMDIPPDLLEPPSGAFPPPPVETAELVLPMRRLSPENFERLCMRIARLEGSPWRVRRYGIPGQKQYGIDVYSRLPSGRYATYQCKRYQTLEKGDIANAVDDFITGRWAVRSEKFVLATSALADRTELEEEIEERERRLSALRPPVAFEVWDEEEISHRLRGHQDVVGLFFGPHWTRRFFGEREVVGATRTDIADIVKEAVHDAQTPRLVSNDWAPARLRPRLDELRISNPRLFSRLCDHFGNPPEAPLVAAATATPPPWLAAEGEAIWDLLARIAEALGEWLAAARAWERAARMQSGPSAARAFAHGSSDAQMAGDDEGTQRLLLEATAVDPQVASVVLMRLGDQTPPAEQLAVLDALRSDDTEELGLIAARRTLAYLLTPDMDAARITLEEVRKRLPGSWLIEGLEVSLAVQAARLAKLDHRPLDLGSLEAADAKAGRSRESLMSQRRFSEATRLLMLRAEIQALLGDRKKASNVLRTATPDDRVSQEQLEILADAAASRALDPELALEFLEGVAETPTSLRIRLECVQEVGPPADRDAALQRLDDIVASRGDQAAEAAFVRLVATIGPVDIPWSEDAAVLLRSGRHERAAVTAEAMYKLKHEGWEEVAKLLRPYGRTPWAQAALLRAALHPSVDAEAAVQAANDVLASGGSYELRVDAARALCRGRQFARGREVLASVARDPNAPEVTRADAYFQLMHVVGKELGDWAAAGILFDEWVKLRATDTRSHVWAPTIANRRRHLE